MSKIFQCTVPDAIADEIRALQDITGHERPGSLFALLVRLYGQDLRRRMSGDVLPTQDVVQLTPDIIQPIKEQLPATDDNFKFTTPIPGF